MCGEGFSLNATRVGFVPHLRNRLKVGLYAQTGGEQPGGNTAQPRTRLHAPRLAATVDSVCKRQRILGSPRQAGRCQPQRRSAPPPTPPGQRARAASGLAGAQGAALVLGQGGRALGGTGTLQQGSFNGRRVRNG